MRTIKLLAALCMLTMTPVAFAKPPSSQGRACDAKSRCDGELQCVKHRNGKSTCELVCAASTKCPEDQRCVKDGSEMLCRPITDLDL